MNKALKNIINTKVKIQYIFILISILMGIYWTKIIPPFQAPDEFVHFYRAYEISEGHLVSKNVNGDTGNYLPKAIKEFEDTMGAYDIPFNYEKKLGHSQMEEAKKIHLSDERIFFSFPSSAIYSPIPYIPQSLGIFFARAFDLSVYNIILSARLFNLFAYILFTYWAIKILPKLKSCLFLLALMPMTLQQAASTSGDALLFGVSFFMIAYIFRLIFSDEIVHFTRKDFFIISCLSIATALLKPAYFLFFLIVFLIPIKKYKSKQLFWLYNFSISFVTLISLFSWMTFGPGAATPQDPIEQVKWILLNPIAYFKKFIGTFIYYDNLYIEFVGYLGWLDTPIPYVISFLFTIFFTIAITSESPFENQNNFSTFIRGLLLFGFFLLEVVVIDTMIFLAWPQRGLKYVAGVQGRYFIPVFIIFAYGIYVILPRIKKLPKNTFNILVVIFSFLLASYFLLLRYYP
ncbi:DUF2142 domain-containing protein [Neobacillus sp. 114]|uniref:DUF2142 domain-containing protein n=1 Tax=Neobacillus sp. 114 TaxID=3048535 RepID=UPI0024C2DDAA|nr:DUF2142 domain-containing protein [Neobacillus sp. 114]